MNLSPFSSCVVPLSSNASKHSCKECGDVFSEEKSLELHNRIHVMSRDLGHASSPFTSSFSSPSSSSSNLFLSSMTTAVGANGNLSRMPMTTNESMCAEVLANIIDLHVRSKNQTHPSVSNNDTLIANSSYTMIFKCSSCNKNFSNQGNLDAHMRSHQINGAKCEEVLADIIDLHTKNKAREMGTAPVSVKTTNNNNNICKYVFCGSTFTDKSTLEMHSKIYYQLHQKSEAFKKEFQCTFCKEEFSNISTLKAHTKNHSKEFKYNEINSVSLNPSTEKPVTRNMKPLRDIPSSTVEKDASGNLLSKNGFQSEEEEEEEQNLGVQETLGAHGHVNRTRQKLKRTSKEDFAISIGLNTSLKRKRYKCISCKLAFKDLASLKKHSISHSSLKPTTDFISQGSLRSSKFRYTFCKKDLLKLSAPDTHTKSHSESRNTFKCGYCRVKFANSNLFNEHVNVHIKNENNENAVKTRRQSLRKGNLSQCVDSNKMDQKGLKRTVNSNKSVGEKTTIEIETSFAKKTCKASRNVTSENEISTPEHSNLTVVRKQMETASHNVTAEESTTKAIASSSSPDPNCNANCSNGIAKENKSNSNSSQNANSNFTPRVKFVTPRTLFKCNYCNKEFPKPGKLKRHIRIHTGEKPYKCPHCQKCFTQSGNLTHHLRTHNGDKPYMCNVCNKSFSQSSSLTIHKRSHTGERPFACSYCNKRFSHSGPLNHHIRTHTGEKPFKCQFCEKAFPQSSQLRQHVRTHTGERPYKCPQCLKTFTQSSSLNIHLRSHTGEKPFKCKSCEKSFAQSGKLHQHLKVHTADRKVKCPWPPCTKQIPSGKLTQHLWMHMGEATENKQPLKCDICNRVFKQVSNLSQHLRLHTGEKVYECKKCEKVFTQANKLSVHLKSVHAGEKPFKCHYCMKSFSQPADLTLHERTHTGEKPYTCDICQRGFSQTGSLSRHRRIHTGEKPFQCEICEKAFSQSSGLAQHMKTHTQEKPYSCKFCNKAFSFSSKLKEHLTIHTNEKPFQCKTCNKQFRSSSNLSNHKKHCLEPGSNTNKTDNSSTTTFIKTNQNSQPESEIQTSQVLSVAENQVLSHMETIISSLQSNSIEESEPHQSQTQAIRKRTIGDLELKPNISSFTESDLAHIYTFTVSVIGNKNDAVTSAQEIETSLANPNQVPIENDANINTIVTNIDSHVSTEEALSAEFAAATTTSSQVDIFVSGNEEVNDTGSIQIAIPESSENIDGLTLLEQEMRCFPKNHVESSGNIERGTILDSCAYVIETTSPTVVNTAQIACSTESNTESNLQTTVPLNLSPEGIPQDSISNLNLAVSMLESKSDTVDETYQSDEMSNTDKQNLLEMQTFMAESSCKELNGPSPTPQTLIQRIAGQQELDSSSDIYSNSSVSLQNSVPLTNIHLIDKPNGISTLQLPTVYKVSYSLATQEEIDKCSNFSSSTSIITNTAMNIRSINNSNNDLINANNNTDPNLLSLSCLTSPHKDLSEAATVEDAVNSSGICKDFLNESLTEQIVTSSQDVVIATNISQHLVNFPSETATRVTSPYE